MQKVLDDWFGGETPNYSVPVVTTIPELLLNHQISDDQLDMLCQSQSDRTIEIFWASVGGAIGSAPASISTIVHYASSKTPYHIEVADLCQVIIFFACLVLGLAMLFVTFNHGKRIKNLASQIRERTRTRQG